MRIGIQTCDVGKMLFSSVVDIEFISVYLVYRGNKPKPLFRVEEFHKTHHWGYTTFLLAIKALIILIKLPNKKAKTPQQTTVAVKDWGTIVTPKIVGAPRKQEIHQDKMPSMKTSTFYKEF